MAQATALNKVDRLCLSIFLDDVRVAKGCSDDDNTVQSVSTFYRGDLSEDTTVSLKVGAQKAGKIAKDGLQFGARTYDDECLDIVGTLPMDYMCASGM